MARGEISHLWPIRTNFNLPERHSSRTANTVVLIRRAASGMPINRSESGAADISCGVGVTTFLDTNANPFNPDGLLSWHLLSLPSLFVLPGSLPQHLAAPLSSLVTLYAQIARRRSLPTTTTWFPMEPRRSVTAPSDGDDTSGQMPKKDPLTNGSIQHA